MSRGQLSEAELLAIRGQLPDLIPLQKTVHHLSPETLSMVCPPESRLPEAAVCLRDAVGMAVEARYATHESLAHRLYYGSTTEPPQPMAAVFFGRYYLDDAALRLYAAGEHLANAIVSMLEIDDVALSNYRDGRTSRQAVVWQFMDDQHRDHVLTDALRGLGDPWRETMRYRNLWVHDQPPLFAGLGIVFRRGSRWQGKPGGPRMLAFNGGDAPEWTIEKLAEVVIPALHRFGDTLQAVVDNYLDTLGPMGFRVTGDNTSTAELF